jgi:cytoskeletal protein RodZ
MTDKGAKSSPGAILRGARELYDWSIEDVAAELNLLPDMVRALEADDYSNTAGWTYAVGYLRSYARLAGVSLEQAIADYQADLPPKEDGPGTMTEHTKGRYQPVAIHYRWVVTIVVLLLVVGGLYGAYLNRSTDVERGRVDLAGESRNDPVSTLGHETSTGQTDPAKTAKADLAVVLGQAEEGSPKVDSTLEASGNGSEEKLVAAIGGSQDTALTAKPVAGDMAGAPTQSDQIEVQGALLFEPESEQKTQPKVKSKPKPKPKPKPKVKPEAKAKAKAKPKAKPKAQTTTLPAKAKPSVPAIPRATLEPQVADRFVTTEFSTSVASVTQPGGAGNASANHPVSSDTRQLTVRVKESTHVVVWDRDDQTLFRRYVESGKVITLAGKPPFTLQVSYPEGASVIYRGRELAIPVPKSGRNAKVLIGR